MTTDSQNKKQDPNESTTTNKRLEQTKQHYKQTNKQSKVINKLNDAGKFPNASAKLGWLY